MTSYFIDAATGQRVKRRERRKTFNTPTERGTRRYPFKVSSHADAWEKARAVGEEICVVCNGEVFRISPSGVVFFLYRRGEE